MKIAEFAATVLGVTLAGIGLAQGPDQSGQRQDLSGRVETLQGSPVAGAVIALQPTKAGVSLKANLVTRSGPDGSFTVKDAPEGEYRICVPASETSVLDPCVWGGFVTTAQLSREAARVALRVVVNQGAELTLQVADAGGLLASEESRQPRRPGLVAGVSKPGIPFLPMRLTNTSGSQREYRLLVAAQVPLTLTVGSELVELEEVTDTGKGHFTPVADSLKAQVEVLRGTARLDLRVRVKGTK